MKYTLTKRDIGILLGFIGVVVLGLVYYFIYMGYSGKTDELNAASDAMQSRVDVLQELVNRQDELISTTNSNNQKAEELMARFPADYRYEDAILYGIELEEVAPLETLPQISFGEEENIYSFEDITAIASERVKGYIPDGGVGESSEGEETNNEASEEEATTGLPELKRKIITYNNTTDYSGIKNALAYILDRDDRSGLDITAAYDIESGMLTDTLQVKSYYVINSGKSYVEPEMPIVVKGTDNIFDSLSISRPSDRLNMGSSSIVNNGENNNENNDSD